jgi:hypothetical protein
MDLDEKKPSDDNPLPPLTNGAAGLHGSHTITGILPTSPLVHLAQCASAATPLPALDTVSVPYSYQMDDGSDSTGAADAEYVDYYHMAPLR